MSGSAIYDSNAARSSKAQAALRGLARTEMEYRPSLHATAALPFDQHAFFADSQVGYEFHSRNKQLESERIAATGGVRLRMAGCVMEASGTYARRLSEVADDFSAVPGNVEQVAGGDGTLQCGKAVGISPAASLSYRRSRNAQAERRRSDLNSLTLTGGLAYAQPSLGRLSLLASVSNQSYPHRRSPSGQQDGIRVISGMLKLEREAGARLKGSLSAGYIHVDPDLPGVRGFEGPSYGGDLRFTPGGRAAFALAAMRTVEASNRLDVSYYRQDQFSLSMDYAVSVHVDAQLRASWRRRRFAPSPVITDVTPPGSDRNYALGMGLRYALNRRIELSFDGDYQRRNAAADLFDYDGLRAGLTASYRM
ncbi:outer membrane beta-barrel protein [Rhizorhapis suberifaciens]|uniref:Uncharacterized protein n=1 Tax=Rhizorhapis suberifaciens TaxID=13656 RepID=A0A840HUX0_9SPHN|nr:outer membrane beta-barrel protein [Rhizorhapis suberifaciens]MBB4641753.1 hypothetical protein [Rhizorhapis suberifaciens]